MKTGIPVLPEVRVEGKMYLSQLFAGDQYAGIRQSIIDNGQYRSKKGKTLHVKVRATADGLDHEVMALAAITRDPGRSDDFLTTVQDFQLNVRGREQYVQQLWLIYKNSGVCNTATNKISAIISGEGRFKVRRAKKGKKRDAVQQLEELLYQWTRRVNASGPTMNGFAQEPGVITGARGLKAINHQAVRQALVEGSWVGRAVWTPAVIEGLGNFDLPMTIQTISTANLEPMKELAGEGLELFFWKPSSRLLQQIRNPTSKEIRTIIQKFIPKELLNPLKKDGKVLLDPALLMHVKHRSRDGEDFGESFIQPALPALAYEQALMRLDQVSIANLVNRIVVVMVGSADPKSPYSNTAVSQARAELMQQIFEDPGPSMCIVWSGNDVEVKEVGAHSSMVDLKDRFEVAYRMIKLSFGVGDALLSGTTTDGKAAGWAAMLSNSAQLEELDNNLAQGWTTLGERIALENGFTDFDIIYQNPRQLMIDRTEERNQNRQDYVAGAMSIFRYLESQGIDPDAEFRRKAFEHGLDPDDLATLWTDVFMPPQGMAGQGSGAPPGQGGGNVAPPGRTPNNQTSKTTPERRPKLTPIPNK